MTDQRVLDVLYAAGPQWGERKPEDIVAALEAAGYVIVSKELLAIGGDILREIAIAELDLGAALAAAMMHDAADANGSPTPPVPPARA